MSTAPELDLSSLDKDPRLFLYTSLTAGSSHIITATSRMETILKANRIPFLAVDLATDEKCRRLWQRRGGAKKKLPGLVKEGYIIGDLEEVEEWNEFGELKENIGPVPPAGSTAPPGSHTGVSTAPPLSANVIAAQGPQAKSQSGGFDKTKAVALPGAQEMAAIHKAKKAELAAKATAVPAAAAVVVPEAQVEKLTEEGKTSSAEEGKAEVEAKQEVKEVAKEDTKEEPKEEPKEESKEVAKEEPKEGPKEDAKEEIKAKSTEEPQQATASDTTKQDVKEELDVDPPTEGVAGLKIKEEEEEETTVKDDKSKNDAEVGEQTQKQDAKDPTAAGQSVED